MAGSRPERAGVAARGNDDQGWAELADLVLVVAREIQFRGYTDERAVRLSQSEGMVMRYLQRDPAAPPSRIAAATGLQRTNLSTVLRGLEHKGLVERRAYPDDARGVTVHLTELGKTNYSLVRREWGTAVSGAAARRHERPRRGAHVAHCRRGGPGQDTAAVKPSWRQRLTIEAATDSLRSLTEEIGRYVALQAWETRVAPVADLVRNAPAQVSKRSRPGKQWHSPYRRPPIGPHDASCDWHGYGTALDRFGHADRQPKHDRMDTQSAPRTISLRCFYAGHRGLRPPRL